MASEFEAGKQAAFRAAEANEATGDGAAGELDAVRRAAFRAAEAKEAMGDGSAGELDPVRQAVFRAREARGDGSAPRFDGAFAREAAPEALLSGQASKTRLVLKVASGEALDVREFEVHERLSTLFSIRVVAVAANPNLDFEADVGLAASFEAWSRIAPDRPGRWTGVCSELRQIRAEPSGLSTYVIEIVPELWLLDQRRNYRIFQQRTELEIALALLDEWGIAPVLRITGAYKKRKYRVQYAESDYAFFCRMLEDAGITFFFEQDDGKTRLVLADAPEAAALRSPPIAYRDRATAAEREHVTEVSVGRRVRPGRYTVRDHDYRRPPSYQLLASARDGRGVEDRLERYHYLPGAFLFESERGEETPFADDRGRYRTDEGEADALARRRLDAQRATAFACSFQTNALDVAPGAVVGFLDHPHALLGEQRRLLVVASSLAGDIQSDWTHRCEAVSAAARYRPPLATPRPRVSGVESATVVGAPGEEIHTDEFGRVRVHFHWDRESRMDDHSSCWIHVSQPWGGAGFGGVNLPRIGQEVIVDFIGGDPDRPIIVGRVYTNMQKVPYKLPDTRTQSGWKSASTHNTGGYNEIMFEDAAGGELFRVQAEKDLVKLVKHDETITVGNDRSKTVLHSETVHVKVDRTEDVGHDETIDVHHDRKEHVYNDETITVDHDRTEIVHGQETITIDHDRTTTVHGNETVTVDLDRKETVHGHEELTIDHERIEYVGGFEDVTINEDCAHTVNQNETLKTLHNLGVTVGINRTTQVGAVDTVTVGTRHVTSIVPGTPTGPGAAAAATGSATSVTMIDKKIVLTTGAGASITLEGSTIKLEATSVFTVAQDFAGVASMNQTVVGGLKLLELGSGAGPVQVNAKTDLVEKAGGAILVDATGSAALVGSSAAVVATGGDVIIKGAPLVKINP